ncbi:hypothetical protein BH09ACT6_BH09ACT6_01750 [soil metagenome]
MVATMHDTWHMAAEAAELTEVDRNSLWGRQFLNPGVLY